MFEAVQSIVTALITSGVFASILFYKQRKRKAEAEAKSIEAAVEEKYAVGWKELFEQRETKMASLNAKIDKLYADIEAMRRNELELERKMQRLQLELQEALFYKCVVRGCKNRRPPNEILDKISDESTTILPKADREQQRR